MAKTAARYWNDPSALKSFPDMPAKQNNSIVPDGYVRLEGSKRRA
jgi:hypothetical protein